MNAAYGISGLFYEKSSEAKKEVKTMEDKEIVALYWDRNEQAISATDEKYGGYCRRIAVNILQNYQDSEECVNSSYMKVWSCIPPNMPKVFSAFLAKITRNTAIDTYRQSRSLRAGGGELPLIYEELEDCVSDKDSPAEEYERKRLLEVINRFLEHLPRKNRIIFVLRYSLCVSVKEIAARVGKSENAVSVSLNRTRRDLREYLAKEGIEL